MLKLLILILVFFLGPALMFGILQLSKWRTKRSGKRLPFKDQLLRSPGERLRGEIVDISDDLSVYAISASTFPLL